MANKWLIEFGPVSLKEMDCVKLMDRTDSKFVLSFSNLESFLKTVSDHYLVLTINGTKVFSYRTDYFDTPNLDMFTEHHNGKLNRFKVRQREYIESNLKFLEVKFRSNKGRVIKDRIEKTYSDPNVFSGFIHKHTPYKADELNITIINRFNRFTLVDIHMRERVTVDFNLSFTDHKRDLFLDGLVIIEVKQNKMNKQSLVFKTLKETGIRPASVSKYCLGVSMLNMPKKFNNFKKTINMINKLSHVELSA
jgi:hypothetical protein